MAPRKYTYYTFTSRDPVIDDTVAIIKERLNGQPGAVTKFCKDANMSTTTWYNWKNKKTRNTFYSTVANAWAACGYARIPIAEKARKDK